MPVWHEATRQLQDEGRLQMVGIIQEQHPDRARLFMQWKQMDWPILVDSLDLLEVSVVPITLLIDENGIIQSTRPRLPDIESFLASGESDSLRSMPRPAPPAPTPEVSALQAAARDGDVDALRRYADALMLWADDTHLDEIISIYQQAIAKDPDDGPTHFHAGVALRRRHESSYRTGGDFAGAIEHWKLARAIDPNQYIWRRRIQQYGPRLDKPYPFYDWVTQARADIIERGEVPAPLSVEPSGAEFAQPSRTFAAGELEQAAASGPDPDGRIHRDQRGFINIEVVPVPATGRSRSSAATARIHLLFRPNDQIKAHWNNEAEEMVLWIDPPAGWQVDRQMITYPNPDSATSREAREIEFELSAPAGTPPGVVMIPAYALYNVCEDVDGTCLYRRQDIEIPIDVGGTPPPRRR